MNRLSASLAAIAFCMLIAAGTRLAGLNLFSLAYDEAQTVTHATKPIPLLLRDVAQYDPHPPLFYLQMRAWIEVGAYPASLLSPPLTR